MIVTCDSADYDTARMIIELPINSPVTSCTHLICSNQRSPPNPRAGQEEGRRHEHHEFRDNDKALSLHVEDYSVNPDGREVRQSKSICRTINPRMRRI